MTRKIDLGSLPTLLRGEVAAFVRRESFESRADIIASTLLDAGVRVREMWNFRSEGRSAGRIIPLSDNVAQRTLCFSDASDLASQLLECARRLASYPDEMNSIIDVTAFRREELLVLLLMLRHVRPSGKGFHFWYLPASEYSSAWLSRGVIDCHSVVGYPGSLVPGRPDHLVLMLGFELDRARALIEYYEPARISLGRGSAGGSVSPEFYSRNLDVFNAFLAYAMPQASVEFEFPPDDALVTASVLRDVLDCASDCNHIVAPLNNKVTTVGAGLVALERPEVQVVYAPAFEYNEVEYSKPSAIVYDISVAELFGQLGAAVFG